MVQYPVKKTSISRNIQNILPDGSVIALADPDGWMLNWELTYSELSSSDIGLIQTHFGNSMGPFHAFTFIDPTGNMLVSSEDLTNSAWLNNMGLTITANAADPFGGSAAFTVTNTAQAAASITQTLTVPAGFQYCLSLYAACISPATVTLTRQGPAAVQSNTFPVGTAWNRFISAGKLNDSGVGITVGFSLAAGEQVQIYGIQLEAQPAPSRYRPTAQTGGVYPNAHWASDQLTITAQGLNQFSSTFAIETPIIG